MFLVFFLLIHTHPTARTPNSLPPATTQSTPLQRTLVKPSIRILLPLTAILSFSATNKFKLVAAYQIPSVIRHNNNRYSASGRARAQSWTERQGDNNKTWLTKATVAITYLYHNNWMDEDQLKKALSTVAQLVPSRIQSTSHKRLSRMPQYTGLPLETANPATFRTTEHWPHYLACFYTEFSRNKLLRTYIPKRVSYR